MIQRIQSLYLGVVCIAMVAFLKVSVWVKVDWDHDCTMKSYALIVSTGQYIILPYIASALLACCLMVTAAYTIIRHDNRKLQLRLVAGIGRTLVLLLLLIFMLIKKANAAYLLGGCCSYQIGIILPIIALVASLFARHHIKKDEQLVNADRLR